MTHFSKFPTTSGNNLSVSQETLIIPEESFNFQTLTTRQTDKQRRSAARRLPQHQPPHPPEDTWLGNQAQGTTRVTPGDVQGPSRALWRSRGTGGARDGTAADGTALRCPRPSTRPEMTTPVLQGPGRTHSQPQHLPGTRGCRKLEQHSPTPTAQFAANSQRRGRRFLRHFSRRGS